MSGLILGEKSNLTEIYIKLGEIDAGWDWAISVIV